MDSKTRRSDLSSVAALSLCVLLLGACGALPTNDPGDPAAALAAYPSTYSVAATRDTLYEALGGASGVELLTDNFIIELAGDKRVRHRFAKSDIGRFHHMLSLHVCELADGPCTYTGDNMKMTHGGMNIESAEFNAVVEALMQAMDKTGLATGTQNRLLARLAPMRSDIVGR